MTMCTWNDTALGCGVLVKPENDEVITAGGWLVQMLPGATEETISQIEKNIMNLAKSPTTLIREGKTARDICEALSEGLRPENKVPEYCIKPRFTCTCSMDKVWHAPKRCLSLSLARSLSLPLCMCVYSLAWERACEE